MSLGVGAVALRYLPEQAPAVGVLVAAALGGLLPDFDLLAEHRKTLHFPLLAPLAAGLSLAVALLAGTPAAWLIAALLAGSGLHAVAELFAGSPERAPWDPTAERSVYNHVLGRWHRPRRWVRYSGAPEDWLCGACFAVLALATPTGAGLGATPVVAILGLAGGYTLLRKRLPALAALAAGVAPPGLRRRLPRLDVDERESGATTLRLRARN